MIFLQGNLVCDNSLPHPGKLLLSLSRASWVGKRKLCVSGSLPYNGTPGCGRGKDLGAGVCPLADRKAVALWDRRVLGSRPFSSLMQ